MAFLATPEDYEALGLTPPEHIAHGTEAELELSRFSGDHICLWHQAGAGDIYCDNGNHRHGRTIETDKILIGTDEQGVPQFKIIAL